jgi:hypothetical protein
MFHSFQCRAQSLSAPENRETAKPPFFPSLPTVFCPLVARSRLSMVSPIRAE